MDVKQPWRWVGRVGMLIGFILIIAVAGLFAMRKRLPAEFSQDVRAGLAARQIQDPDARFQKFLEVRYGPMSDPLNRQKAFLDYFNPDHIRALQFLVQHSPEAQRPQSIAAAARWIEKYRESLDAEERTSLRAKLQGPEGLQMLRRATAQYNLQDVRYRGQTVPVVSQLLKTVSTLQTP